MSLEWGLIGGKLLTAVLPTIAKQLVKLVNSNLNPSDVEKALKAGIESAEEWNKSQCSQSWLFYRCDDKQTRDFLQHIFQYSPVQSELKKPLENQGTPDVAILVKAFQQVAADLNIDLNQHSLESWVSQFVNTYFAKTSTYLKFQVAKEDYFEQVGKWFDDVKFAGISVAGQEVDKSEKLAQIFVMPDVVEEVQHRRELLLEPIDSRQAELIREQRQLAELDNSSGRQFLAAQLLNQNQSRRGVLLGAPGSGKTTLMSYFAVMLAQKNPETLGLDSQTDWLPILIRIRDLARYPDISILDYARQFAEKTMAVKTLPTGFFEYWLEDGRAIILLDGLDEVAEEGKRYEVVRRIDNFLGQFKENRAIITSRPAGYKRDFFRTEDYPHFQLQPFDGDKVEDFINHWYDSRFPDKAEAERRKESLRNALKENDRIKLLARNPLLLTIIALIHRYQARLPKQRYLLYEKAVETLLTAWDANKEISNHGALEYLQIDDLRRLMERLAYWIHTQGSTGDKEGGTLIDKDELIEQLSSEIKREKQIKLHQAEEEAKRFLKLIRERTGLLNEQGQDCYAFVHKTFQEYLCAEEINYQADNEDDFEIVLQHISEHLHDPHWREVLLLLIAQQKPKKAAKAIRKVLQNQSEYECWLHRDLLFAGSCLGEDPKNLKVVDEKLSTDILTRLVELEVSDFVQIGERVKEQVFKTLCCLGESSFEVEALHLLKDRADVIDRGRLQRYRAALGEKEEVIKSLLELLRDQDEEVCNSAAYDLGKLGNSSPTMAKALVKLLQDPVSLVRGSAAIALGELGNSSPMVIEPLQGLLQDPDSSVRLSAANALGDLGNSSSMVIKALVKLLQEDPDWEVRDIAAIALGELSNSSSIVVKTLLQLLQDKAAEALGELGNSSSIVVEALLQLLQDPEWEVRGSTAFVLSNLGNSSPIVVEALLQLLQEDPVSLARGMAADALGKLGNSSPMVVKPLQQLLQDPDSSVRISAAKALLKLGNSSSMVVEALQQIIQEDEDPNSWKRISAAKVLIELGNSSPMVVEALLQFLQDPNSSVRRNAAEALGMLGTKFSEVITAVAQWIEQHQDSKYMKNGINALWDLVTDSR